MELAQFTEVERLLLESLYEYGPLELTDKTLTSVARSLGTNGKVLTLAKNKLVRQGLIIPVATDLKITPDGKALFEPAPTVAIEPAKPAKSSKSAKTSAPMTSTAVPVQPAAQPTRAWWQFWKRAA